MKTGYKTGDSVAVKKGTKDPDYGNDITGWQGRITQINEEDDDEPVVCIEWDSKTLEKMPRAVIERSKKDELDWTRLYLNVHEIEPAKPRDDRRNVVRTVRRITKKYGLDQAPDQEQRPTPSRQITHEKLIEHPFLVTVTGEPYQLARVHYELVDRREVTKVFSRLRCMDYDPPKKRWVWLYEEEAKKLKLARSYSSIPAERKPLILGSFFFSLDDDSMYLDTNSFARAWKAIVFFDKYLKRALAGVTEIEIVNRFFAPSSEGAPKHADFFDKQPSRKPEDVFSKIEQITSPVTDTEEKRRIAFSFIEESAKQPLPEIERLPVHFYEEGIGMLEAILNTRTAIAHKHWLGHKEYSIHDLVHEMIPR